MRGNFVKIVKGPDMQLFGVLIPEKEQLIATVTDVVKGKAGLPLYASLFGLAIGLYAIAAIFIMGHAHTINTSNLVPGDCRYPPTSILLCSAPAAPLSISSATFSLKSSTSRLHRE